MRSSSTGERPGHAEHQRASSAARASACPRARARPRRSRPRARAGAGWAGRAARRRSGRAARSSASRRSSLHACELGAALRVGLGVDELVALDDRAHVEPAAADEQRRAPAREHVVDAPRRRAAGSRRGRTRSPGIDDVQQVVRHAVHLRRRDLAGAEVEPAVDLPRVSRDDLALECAAPARRRARSCPTSSSRRRRPGEAGRPRRLSWRRSLDRLRTYVRPRGE